jgi:cytochrome c-type biogenesis protein CcmH
MHISLSSGQRNLFYRCFVKTDERACAATALRSLQRDKDLDGMNAIFYVSAFLMLLVAMSFATSPLLRRAKTGSRTTANLPLLAAIAAFLLAIALYAAIGRPDIANSAAIQGSAASVSTRAAADSGRKAASVTTLLAGLEQRLQENPDDAGGWLLLAKSYDHLGRHGDAAAAYDKAATLGMTDNALEARLK